MSHDAPPSSDGRFRLPQPQGVPTCSFGVELSDVGEVSLPLGFENIQISCLS